MSRHIEDFRGKKINLFTVLHRSETRLNGNRSWLCLCECGNTRLFASYNVKSGNKFPYSCGCVKKPNLNIKHGMSSTRVYVVWSKILDRCDNKTSKCYVNYGGRGISYEPSWRTFQGFWDDMGIDYEIGLTIDRKDVNLGYCRSNCRWIPKARQSQGTRKRKSKCSSVFKGVSLQPNGSWMAQIQIDGIVSRSPHHITQRSAAEAYDIMALELFGEFATTNKSLGLLDE